jgi:hypothetical protein
MTKNKSWSQSIEPMRNESSNRFMMPSSADWERLIPWQLPLATSYSLDSKQTFPLVTIPDFEIRGSDIRVQADAACIFWMPLVTDETRVAWEEYALASRSQIDEAFLENTKQREKQDAEYGLTSSCKVRCSYSLGLVVHRK